MPPKDWEVPGQVPPKGGSTAGKYASKEGHDRQVGLPTSGKGNEGSGVEVGEYVRPPQPE